MINRVSRNALACALLATTSLCFPAIAHAESPAPQFTSVDDHGVDLVSGLPFLKMEEGGIGSGPGRVSMQRIWSADAGFQDNWSGGLYRITTSKMYVQIAGISDTFSGSGTTWTSDKADGATLTVDGQGYWNYTARDGTRIQFSQLPGEKSFNCPSSDASQCRVPLSIIAPSGLKFTLTWEEMQDGGLYRRLTGVSSSAGYSLAIQYVPDTPGPGKPGTEWWNRSTVTFNNSANPPSQAPTITYAYPTSGIINVTDPAGRTWRLTTNSPGDRLLGVRRPGSASDNISYSYTTGTVSSATKDGVTNTYSRSVIGSIVTETITNPLSQQTVVITDLNKGRPTSFKNGLNKTWSYAYDSNSRLAQVVAPELNSVTYGYDGRGNVTTTTRHAKSNGVPDIVTSATFDATCTNVVKCNKPNSTTDAKGNVTDYTYDPTHGGVATITSPAPILGGTRPQTRNSYSQVTSASGDLAYMLTGVSACQTGSSCAGTADETKTTTVYNSNLLATSVTSGNGTGTLAATSTMTYDARGNLDTVDGPLAGTADTIKYRYDSANQPIGTVSPDPDGGGTLKMRATRLTYRSDGQVSKRELGTVNSQSDADWALFAPLQTVDITFDTNSRAVQQKLSASGTDYTLTQTSYDALGRVDCAAVRMNVAVYGSLPASACTLSTEGSDGPDQITKTTYDAAGHVTQVQAGVGTSDAANERTLTYTNNRLLSTLKDAENNLTTYEYDGFDRLSKTRFPSPTKGAATSSATDYEQLGYDANSNVVSRRLRDGNTIAFTFDNLNRATLKDLPGTEPDVSYGYDNLGRLKSASQTGNALLFTYDALGRKLTEVGPRGTVTSEWDLAGRRTKLTYPGTGLYVNYDYLVTGEVQKIRENGATTGVGVLATYAYDNLGNRTSRTFGNGGVQGYNYDPVSRLASLSNDLSGTTNDLSATFSYNAAGQIANTTRTGDTYAFDGLVLIDRNYTSNGLNQYGTAGSAAFTYDARGNLTSDGTNSYGYSSENLLTSASSSGGTTLTYDPLKRLYEVADATPLRFAYDGLNEIAEYNSSNTLYRRFVFEPGMDRPIVQIELTGTDQGRRFMSSDERGSIVSRTRSDGSVNSIHTYDEYGIPGSNSDGRFLYTGQAWITELGMYYYKARMYSATLGRFMQTDPIGMAGGPNLYAYVSNDPINLQDPVGMLEEGGDEYITSHTYTLNQVCTGTRINGGCGAGGIADGLSGFSTAGVGGQAPAYGSTAYGGGGYYVCTNCTGTAPEVNPGDIVVSGQHEYQWVSTTTFYPIQLASTDRSTQYNCERLGDSEQCTIVSPIKQVGEEVGEWMEERIGATDEVAQCTHEIVRQSAMSAASGAARGGALGGPPGAAVGGIRGAAVGAVIGATRC
jgi:RHS repeat-associated protein